MVWTPSLRAIYSTVPIAINGMLKFMETVGRGVMVGESEPSELIYADDSLGISELRRFSAMKVARKWRLSANVETYARVICNNRRES